MLFSTAMLSELYVGANMPESVTLDLEIFKIYVPFIVEDANLLADFIGNSRRWIQRSYWVMTYNWVVDTSSMVETLCSLQFTIIISGRTSYHNVLQQKMLLFGLINMHIFCNLCDILSRRYIIYSLNLLGLSISITGARAHQDPLSRWTKQLWINFSWSESIWHHREVWVLQKSYLKSSQSFEI